jgi:hypothetical protein
MSKISKIKAKSAETWVEYPDIPGFEVKLNYIGRDVLTKLRNRCLVYKFNKRTRQREEEVDNDKFLEGYVDEVIKDWKGLKMKHLLNFLPVDISQLDAEEDIPFDKEDALELLKNSTVFDQFITDAMADFEKFSTTKNEEDEKN